MEIQMELSSVIKQSFSFSDSHYDCVIIDFNCISVHYVIYFVCFKGTVCETQWTQIATFSSVLEATSLRDGDQTQAAREQTFQ